MKLDLVDAEQGAFQTFFKDLFFEDIEDKLPPLPTQQFAMMADMQYRAKLHGYLADWPGAKTFLIEVDEQKAGKLVLNEGKDDFRIVDLMISKALRSRGIGREVLHQIGIDAAKAGKEVRLSVARGNPAIHLYLREGFKIDTETQTQIDMYKV